MVSLDGLSREDLLKLGAWEQAQALLELSFEIKHLTDKKIDANTRFRAAQMVAVDNPSKENKVAVIAAKAVVEKLTIEMAGRKEQVKILQTALRSTPA